MGKIVYNGREYLSAGTASTMQGATSTTDGVSGLVPQPLIADKDKVLKGDGTWGTAGTEVEANPSGTVTDELKKIDIDGTIYNIAGGTINVYGAFIDTSKILLPETKISGNGSYTAQEDCFITLLYYLGNWATNVALDNEDIISANNMTPNCWNYVIFPVKKGQELTYNLGYNGWLKIYGVKGGSNPISAPIIYSETEREVGVWIDNKPLYEKTIHTTFTKSSSWQQIIHNISNIENIVDCEAFVVDQNTMYEVPQYRNSSMYFVVGVNSSVVYYINTWLDSGGDISITLRYTKTTDVAGSGSYNTLGIPNVHYSTDEQVIGTWIDGKPLYQKTITHNTALPYRQWGIIDINVNNALIVDWDGKIFIDNSSFPFSDLNYHRGADANEYCCCMGYDSHTLQVYQSIGSNYTVTCNINVRYTKTTD